PVRRRVRPAPCIESLPDKGVVRQRVPLSAANSGASVWMKKASA
ncbi:hypothetical protein A2U01_0078449, partial [Trifolium medium]|nr:hypothetical protein [Trifolium medium]